MNTKVDIVWQTANLDRVLENWVDGYKPEHGKVVGHDAYIDLSKRQVAFRLYIEVPEQPKP